MKLVRFRRGNLVVALLSVVAAAGAVVLSPTAAGLGVETVLAADSVSVVVDVVRGTKGASGSDQRSNKHSSVLGRVPGYGGWKFLDSMKFSLSASGASAGSGAVAGRTLAVKLESFAGGKAKTRVSVTDPGGRDHKITSSLGKGGTTVLTAQSSGGREVHLFIVTVNW